MHLSPFIHHCEDCENRLKIDINCNSENQLYCNDCLIKQDHLDQDKVRHYLAGFSL